MYVYVAFASVSPAENESSSTFRSSYVGCKGVTLRRTEDVKGLEVNSVSMCAFTDSSIR